MLTESGLEYFHMTDFENSQGQFNGWTEDRRRALMNKLLPIIQDHTFWSIGCIVLSQWVDSILSSAVRQICGDAYGLGTLACWRHLGKIFNKHDAWMECAMETGAKGRGALQLFAEEDSKIPEWQEGHRLYSLAFRDKRIFPPLQAADILAYELYKQSARQFGQETSPPRYPLKVLGSQIHQWVYLQEEHLRELNEDLTRQLARWD